MFGKGQLVTQLSNYFHNMSKIQDFFDGLCTLIKTIKGNMIRRTGIGLIVLGGSWFGAGILGIVRVSWGDIEVSVDGSFGTPEVVTWLATLITLTGLGLVVFACLKKEGRKERNSIVVEHLGTGEAKPFKDMSKSLPRGLTHDPDENIVIDQNPYIKNLNVIDPKQALDELLNLERDLKRKSEQVSNLEIVYAGMAPVPFLFCAGYLLSNKTKIHPLDWNRQDEKWHPLNESAKGYYLSFIEPDAKEAKEIAITFPLTFDINEAVLLSEIGEMPIVRAELIDPATNQKTPHRIDLLSSRTDQARCVKQFQEFINGVLISYPKVERIHLSIAAQASFSFQLGRQVLPKNHGDIVIHQFSRNGNTKYPWAVVIATDSITVQNNGG
ncbi:MAG: SAVED domain-containing protein [Desulfovibrio sp.]|uniref:SAVED domain-containing protein n=1 Tax=Desulfovibrio sp. 7SRBS1 TaxID=3378064 RepID=UPI003B406206